MRYGISAGFVGGCCGSTPDFVRALVSARCASSRSVAKFCSAKCATPACIHSTTFAAPFAAPVDVEFLPKGQHDLGRNRMAAKIQEAVDRTQEGMYEAILLGYGPGQRSRRADRARNRTAAQELAGGTCRQQRAARRAHAAAGVLHAPGAVAGDCGASRHANGRRPRLNFWRVPNVRVARPGEAVVPGRR